MSDIVFAISDIVFFAMQMPEFLWRNMVLLGDLFVFRKNPVDSIVKETSKARQIVKKQ